MSVAASTWAWEQDVPFGEKLVLLAVADWSRDGDVCFYSQARLAGKIGMSVRALRENIARLERRSLLVREERRRANGSQTSNRIVLTRLSEAERREAEDDEGEADPAGGSRRRPAGEGGRPAAGPETKGRRQPSSSSAQGQLAITPATRAAIEGVPTAMVRDGASLLKAKTKVGTRIVTEEEMAVAAAALSQFNEQAGSDFGLGAQLVKIVGRIRERPAYTAADHARLIASAFRVRWWERTGSGRRPTPGVIYGNGEVFEAVIQDATDEKAAREPSGTTTKKFVRKGARRPW